MGRNWYQDMEDELEERNEAIGRAFIAANKPELLKQEPVKESTESLQLSLFEEAEQAEKKSGIKEGRVGSTRGTEYILLSKRGRPVKVRYEEGYGPEVEDEDENEL